MKILFVEAILSEYIVQFCRQRTYQLFLASVNVVSVAAADATLNVKVCKKKRQSVSKTQTNTSTHKEQFSLFLSVNDIDISRKQYEVGHNTKFMNVPLFFAIIFDM